jgi:hypothetical protein
MNEQQKHTARLLSIEHRLESFLFPVKPPLTAEQKQQRQAAFNLIERVAKSEGYKVKDGIIYKDVNELISIYQITGKTLATFEFNSDGYTAKSYYKKDSEYYTITQIFIDTTQIFEKETERTEYRKKIMQQTEASELAFREFIQKCGNAAPYAWHQA